MSFHYLLDSMGMVDSTPDLLMDETHCFCHFDIMLLLGFPSSCRPNVQHSRRPRTSCEFPRLEVFAIILGIILKFFEEEINLHSEHVGFLDGVHASLAWLEAIIAPTLVGHHLLDQ